MMSNPDSLDYFNNFSKKLNEQKHFKLANDKGGIRSGCKCYPLQ
jgi:hypothetical protein